eukprot:SAG11_NODE_2973_length_2800_cov_1.339134_4_plen_190_part_00
MDGLQTAAAAPGGELAAVAALFPLKAAAKAKREETLTLAVVRRREHSAASRRRAKSCTEYFLMTRRPEAGSGGAAAAKPTGTKEDDKGKGKAEAKRAKSPKRSSALLAGQWEFPSVALPTQPSSATKGGKDRPMLRDALRSLFACDDGDSVAAIAARDAVEASRLAIPDPVLHIFSHVLVRESRSSRLR